MSAIQPSSHSFSSQGIRLNYVDWGNPDAPLLLLIHGNKDHSRSWDWTAEALREDWHIIAPDLRGHGDSGWSPEGRYDFASYVYDLVQLVSHVGAARMTIVAHSLGAHIALRYAGLYPETVERLVAIETVSGPPEIEVERIGRPIDVRMRRWITDRRAAAGRSPRRFASKDEALARMHGENKGLSEARARHLTHHGIGRNADRSWSWKFDNTVGIWPVADITDDELQYLWRRITCPVLMLHGTESWQSDVPAMLARSLPDGRTVDLEQAGHWLHHDRFDAFLAEIRAFLTR